jgi:hypothetical protein
MLSFPVVRPSLRMETPFFSIRERLTPAWPWPPVASVPFSHGWIRIPAQSAQGRCYGSAKPVVAQLATSRVVDSPRMSALYFGPIPRGRLRYSR